MRYVEQTVILKSDCHYGKRVPPDSFGQILRTLPGAITRSIRMAFEGRSTGGRRLSWLSAASDVRFVGHSGDDETVLHFEVPTFGDAVEEIYRAEQLEIWPTKPTAEDTGFELLQDVLTDVGAGNADSERFDSPLLKTLVGLGKGLNGDFQEIRISGSRRREQQPAIINSTVVETADRLRSIIPVPARVRIVGVLDMIRASTNSFELVIENGARVRGVLVQGGVESLTDLFKKDVVVVGRAIYRPSGKLLRIEAEQLRFAENESSIWSQIPEPREANLDLAALRKPQGPRSGVAAIIGKWPGDESEEEIERLLEAIS